jgi:hypothetical protein
MPGSVRAAGTIEAMAGFFAGVVTGIAAVGLLLIVLTPSRRVRAEARLDREVETRLLLGVDPEGDTERATVPPDDRPTDFDAAELQALRQIGTERSSSRRGSRRT